MTTAVIAKETQVEAAKASLQEAVAFSPVSCLLSIEELAEKADELYTITWNGINK